MSGEPTRHTFSSGGKVGDRPSPQEDDLRLLQRSAAGDARAFHQLVDRHADRLYRLAVMLVGHAADAEDVVQETFAGAYRGLKGFEERASVGTWLTRILVTQAALFRRKKKRIERTGSEVERSQESSAERTERRMDVRAAVAALPEEFREVLALREFEQMSYEQIAAVLEVPVGTVESRLHRARAALKAKLKAYL